MSDSKSEAKKGIFERLGAMSDRKVSLLGSLAVGVIIFSTGIIGVLSIFMINTDFSVYKHMNIVQKFVFPMEAIVASILYLHMYFRIRNEKKSIIKIVKSNPVFLIFTIMIFLIMISQAYHGFGYVLEGFQEVNAFETFDMEVGYFLFVLFCATQVKLPQHKTFLLRALIVVSMILAVAGFVIWGYKPEPGAIGINRPEGFSSIFGNSNYYTYFLSCVVPLTASEIISEKNIIWKLINIIAFLGNTVTLSVNNCTGGWVGATGGMIFIIITCYIIDKKFDWKPITLFFMFMVALYLPGHFMGTFEKNLSDLGSDMTKIMNGDEDADMAGSGRWIIWTTTMGVINDNKLLGTGFEGPYYRDDIYAVTGRPHNEFMQYAVFHGIPVAVLYFVGCLGIYIRALKKKKELDGQSLSSLTGAFGYLVGSFFGITVFSTAMFLFVLMGMGYVHETSE